MLSNQFVFAQALTVTLAPSDYNGYNISCFGVQDGYISADVSGGTAPYSYTWSNYYDTQTITGLSAGYYHVVVHDASNQETDAEITLVEPEYLRFGYSAGGYSGYNVSCHFCFDGWINTSGYSGVPPYAYDWTDGTSAQNRTGMHAGQYTIVVSDLNGCTVSQDFNLTAPERDDWTMNGNAGTNPSTQYIGTSDAKDLVFKTKGVQAIRIDTTGKVKMNNFIGKPGMLFIDSSGYLQSGFRISSSCQFPQLGWLSTPPNFLYTCPPTIVSINSPYIPSGNSFGVTGNSYFDGAIGIGIDPTSATYNANHYKLVVEGKIAGREVNVSANNWPDYVFDKDYRLAALDDISAYVSQYKHLPNMPSATEIENGGQNLGELQRLQQEKIEELYLYILKLEERIKSLESKN